MPLMRIGIFGGTFDPIHLGHLLLAETCREACQLDQVVFVPCAQSPHKRDTQPSDNGARLEMLRLAIGGHQSFSVSEIELQRGGVSYTVDTVESMSSERPDAELFLLLGADSLAQFHLWKQPERICDLATLVMIGRPDTDSPALRSDLFAAAPALPVRLLTCQAPLVEISSSDIRNRVAACKSIRYRTPRAVEAYIGASGLYQDESS